MNVLILYVDLKYWFRWNVKQTRYKDWVKLEWLMWTDLSQFCYHILCLSYSVHLNDSEQFQSRFRVIWSSFRAFSGDSEQFQSWFRWFGTISEQFQCRFGEDLEQFQSGFRADSEWFRAISEQIRRRFRAVSERF